MHNKSRAYAHERPLRLSGPTFVEYARRLFARVTDAVAVIGLTAMTLLIAAEVLQRKWPAFWVVLGLEELTRLVLVWVVFLYFGRSYESGGFVRFRALLDNAPPTARRLVDGLERTLIVLFAALLGWQAWKWTQLQYDIGTVSATRLRIPRWIVTAAIPTGCLLLAIAAIIARTDARAAPEDVKALGE